MRDQGKPVVITVTMPDGTEQSWTAPRRPRYIGSWLLRTLPAGTDLYAIRYQITSVAS